MAVGSPFPSGEPLYAANPLLGDLDFQDYEGKSSRPPVHPRVASVRTDGGIDVTVAKGDNADSWGGQRCEFWQTAHTRASDPGGIGEGEMWWRAWSFAADARFALPTGWGLVCGQVHDGEGRSPNGAVYVLPDGRVVFSVKHIENYQPGLTLTAGHRLYCASRILHRVSGGEMDVWMQIDGPPDLAAAPLKTWRGIQTRFPNPTTGETDWDKYGVYCSPGSPTTTLTLYPYARQQTRELAASFAWGTAPVPVPAPDPQPAANVTASIVNGSTLTGSVQWTAQASAAPVTFYIDGALRWTENLEPYVFNGDGGSLDTTTLADGPHSFEVRAGGSLHVVTAIVANNVIEPPTPPPAEPDVTTAIMEITQTLEWMRRTKKTGGLGYAVERTQETHAYKALVALGGVWPTV